MALISVLIPCHNGGRWLRAAVQSVQAQTVKDLEILLYNDGSVDRSLQIMEELAASDSRIRVATAARNGGIVRALNALLSSANGAFIARMDSDDICVPFRFEKQLDYLRQYRLDACGAWTREFGQGLPRTTRFLTTSAEVRAGILFQSPICHPTLFARREVLENLRYRETYRLAEDYDLITRVSAKYQIGNVPEVLLHYRRHQGQATRARWETMAQVADLVRTDALRMQGIDPTPEELRVHNLIRAPRSIRSADDLRAIEEWLLKLLAQRKEPDGKRVIASQWTRAAIRAAPLGPQMLKIFRTSRLRQELGHGKRSDLNVAALAMFRLDYQGFAFRHMRRMGLAA